MKRRWTTPRIHAPAEDQQDSTATTFIQVTGEGDPLMPNRFANLGCALLLALVIPAAGQAQQGKKTPAPKAATAGKYDPPRTPDGHPDLSGTYDAATLT